MQGNMQAAIDRKTVAPNDLPLEFMMNALRLTDGVPAALFAERTGISLAHKSSPCWPKHGKRLAGPRPKRAAPRTGISRRFRNDLLNCLDVSVGWRGRKYASFQQPLNGWQIRAR